MSWEKVKVPASILNPSFILFKKYWTLSDFFNIDSNNKLYFISFFWLAQSFENANSYVPYSNQITT